MTRTIEQIIAARDVEGQIAERINAMLPSFPLTWAHGVATSPYGEYAVEVIRGDYHAVRSQGGQRHKLGEYLTPAQAKRAMQDECNARHRGEM